MSQRPCTCYFSVTLSLISIQTTGCSVLSWRAATSPVSALSIHGSVHWHVMNAEWGRNSSFIFRCPFCKPSAHYAEFPNINQCFSPYYFYIRFMLKASVNEQEGERKVMIVPSVHCEEFREVYITYCTVYSCTWDRIANTTSWNGTSFYNARAWVSLPLTFFSLSKMPLSQQANICDQQRFRDYSQQQSSVCFANKTEKNSKRDVTSAGWHLVWRVMGYHCRYGFKKKVMLFLKPLSKTWTRLKWKKSINLTVTLHLKYLHFNTV